MDKAAIWASLIKNMQETLDKYKFVLYYPNNKKTPELPLIPEGDDGKALIFSNSTNSIKISYELNKFSLLFSSSPVDENGFAAEFVRTEQALLESDEANDKDIKWLASEFSEAIQRSFGSDLDGAALKKNKLPQTVSKATAKSGEGSYDLVTLASRFTVCYPELRALYRENIEANKGEFQSEEFFMTHGVPAVMSTIRGNYPQTMKKLFNMLNDIFEYGTNETQSLIAVTLLGDLHKDKQLLENAKPYMSDSLRTTVTEVCKYLASGRSKSDRLKLINPPAYKPKKKKGGLMSRLMGGK